MSILYKLKRRAYILIKKGINIIPPLKEINRKRKERIDNAKRASISEHGVQVASKVCEILNENGIPCFVMFGTLLGMVRDGRIIPNDCDLDFGVLIPEGESWSNVDELLAAKGYKLHHKYLLEGVVTEQTYTTEGFSFDLFGLFQIDGQNGRRAFFFSAPDNMMFDNPGDREVRYLDLPIDSETKQIEVQGYQISIPSKTVEILETVYGPNWKTPDPNWISGTGWAPLPTIGKRIVI